jgi:hypothetical protein
MFPSLRYSSQCSKLNRLGETALMMQPAAILVDYAFSRGLLLIF